MTTKQHVDIKNDDILAIQTSDGVWHRALDGNPTWAHPRTVAGDNWNQVDLGSSFEQLVYMSEDGDSSVYRTFPTAHVMCIEWKTGNPPSLDERAVNNIR